MGKQKSVSMGSFAQELFQVGVYKRNQGRVTRQVTFFVVAVVALFGVYRLYYTLQGWDENARYLLVSPVALAGLWLGYRLVNFPRFADFLIAVEAEMNKVSWPTKKELVRSSIVVIVVIVLLATLLFTYDFLWRSFFQFIGVAP